VHALLPPWCIHAIQHGSELLFVEGVTYGQPANRKTVRPCHCRVPPVSTEAV
jgi:hypothetical protein